MKIVIVGGVAGGASVATRLRRNSEENEIVIIEKSKYISFANCGMPYYIGDKIKNRDNLILNSKEDFKKNHNVDVILKTEVIGINDEKNYVKVINLDTNETYNIDYDVLVLSPGAKPIVPNFIDENVDNLFTLRNIDDMDKIKEYINNSNPTTVNIIGAGMIGVEMAENLSNLGLNVNLIDAAPHVIRTLDEDFSNYVHKYLRKNNINLYLDKKVKQIFKDKIIFDDEEILKTSLTILSIGVVPDTEFLKDSNIELGKRGEIIVNDALRTNIKNIYALGDAISVKNYITKEDTLIPLAGPANKQGRIVADNITGKSRKYIGTIGTSILKLFDMNIATTGMNEEVLKSKKIDYDKVVINTSPISEYYEYARNIKIKLLFDKKGVILGGQVIGYKGVDKRIDIISTAIYNKMTVYDMQDLELSYAPPFSKAKDPLNVTAQVAVNILDGKTSPIYIEELKEIVDEIKGNKEETKYKNSIILDVRTKEEYDYYNIEGSINIPLDEIRYNIDKLSKYENIYVYCAVGYRGYIAEQILKNNKILNVKNLIGGISEYITTYSI